ncbi:MULTISPECIES: LacI family DNA-binding transcriptional regulator [unclassified Roseitalea]|uniref:LacI family DNA-binding transcriptional regulator n=1 Tax=unclassified Roseitalea TaxID=2639107 RepID=UPI00273EA8C0|nr:MULTISPECIES: LacI family DNA-binding transcriptional regulator [unclassified Roseitalea]
MAGEKITSLDVARLAGVSQSAVSRAFTPGASISAKTVRKVREAAEELGYRPNVLARSLITGRTRIIGLVVAYLDNQFYPVALEHLSNALQARGYHVLVFMAGNETRDVPAVMQELLDYQVDGIITASVAISNELARRCQAAGIPVVLFNRGQDDPRLCEVTSDNVAGSRAAAEFLVAGGHRRIAHISGWQGSSTGRHRAQGFVAALKDAGLEPLAVVDGMYRRDTAAQLTRALFDRPSPPDAIFVGNDHMAFAVMDTVRFEIGLSVPDHVSIVGYDDVPIAAWPAYRLTTVRQPVRRMVSETVEILLGQIEGTVEAGQKRRIESNLVVRASARTPKGWSA